MSDTDEFGPGGAYDDTSNPDTGPGEQPDTIAVLEAVRSTMLHPKEIAPFVQATDKLSFEMLYLTRHLAHLEAIPNTPSMMLAPFLEIIESDIQDLEAAAELTAKTARAALDHTRQRIADNETTMELVAQAIRSAPDGDVHEAARRAGDVLRTRGLDADIDIHELEKEMGGPDAA